MRFSPTAIVGAVVVELDRHEDDRGWFARAVDAAAFQAAGLTPPLCQVSLSHNERAGTLRGLHLQGPPHRETKLVRCVRGAIFDVAVDLREGSPTRGRWVSAELTADNAHALYIAPGLAHGFQTLEDDSDVLYCMAEPFVAEASRGVRWDDPAFAIRWPSVARRTISDRDRAYPDRRP